MPEKKEKTPLEKLTPKQRKFVQEYIAGGATNAAEAVRHSYNVTTNNCTNVLAYDLMHNEKIVKALESIGDRIPDDLLVEKHLELLNVPRVIRKKRAGAIIEETEELDSQAVAKGLDMAYKIKGTYAPEKNETLYRTEAHLSEQQIEQLLASRALQKEFIDVSESESVIEDPNEPSLLTQESNEPKQEAQ